MKKIYARCTWCDKWHWDDECEFQIPIPYDTTPLTKLMEFDTENLNKLMIGITPKVEMDLDTAARRAIMKKDK